MRFGQLERTDGFVIGWKLRTKWKHLYPACGFIGRDPVDVHADQVRHLNYVFEGKCVCVEGGERGGEGRRRGGREKGGEGRGLVVVVVRREGEGRSE